MAKAAGVNKPLESVLTQTIVFASPSHYFSGPSLKVEPSHCILFSTMLEGAFPDRIALEFIWPREIVGWRWDAFGLGHLIASERNVLAWFRR